MGDTTNWEFAAAVAAVSFGLGGLLLFTMIGTIGSWRVFAGSSRAANEAAKASLAVQDLARYLATRETMRAASTSTADTDGFADLRRQADALVDQQARLQDAVRNLVEAGVLRTEDSGRHLGELEASIKRLEEHLSAVAAAVANLAQKQS
ncbi:MAG TPA: hypothetical protein VEZ14_10040 [Dehalococcoidia bacterium]|nr:hypothetical protein [Dehalococcoidia bacterium]